MEFDSAVAKTHASIWAALESQGLIIGAHDLQIAATALHQRHALATLNTKEFQRIAGLQLVDVAPFVRPLSAH